VSCFQACPIHSSAHCPCLDYGMIKKLNLFIKMEIWSYLRSSLPLLIFIFQIFWLVLSPPRSRWDYLLESKRLSFAFWNTEKCCTKTKITELLFQANHQDSETAYEGHWWGPQKVSIPLKFGSCGHPYFRKWCGLVGNAFDINPKCTWKVRLLVNFKRKWHLL
jgi:hypothetical protein